jgi:hypothetical protein
LNVRPNGLLLISSYPSGKRLASKPKIGVHWDHEPTTASSPSPPRSGGEGWGEEDPSRFMERIKSKIKKKREAI